MSTSQSKPLVLLRNVALAGGTIYLLIWHALPLVTRMKDQGVQPQPQIQSSFQSGQSDQSDYEQVWLEEGEEWDYDPVADSSSLYGEAGLQYEEFCGRGGGGCGGGGSRRGSMGGMRGQPGMGSRRPPMEGGGGGRSRRGGRGGMRGQPGMGSRRPPMEGGGGGQGERFKVQPRNGS